MHTQTEVVEFLNTELNKIFPTSGILPQTRTVIGESNIYLRYTNAAKKEDCQNAILENDPAYMMFIFHKERSTTGFSDTSYFIDAPITHGRVLKNAGVSFRKIKASSEMAAAVKLVEWFKKNSQKFLSLGLR